MAEFCLECWNRLNGRKDTEKKYEAIILCKLKVRFQKGENLSFGEWKKLDKMRESIGI